jgi:hypothetical protein
MTAVFQLDPQFVLAEGIPLGAEDLGYGFDRGFVKPQGLVDLAADEVARGNTDPVLVELAVLLRDETYRVPEVLTALDDPERIHDPRESARKWLYLQLKAAFQLRDRLSDPFGLVELLYADFDYPPDVAPFVRYMPLGPGEKAGERAMFRRWAEYLERERAVLARRSGA